MDKNIGPRVSHFLASRRKGKSYAWWPHWESQIRDFGRCIYRLIIKGLAVMEITFLSPWMLFQFYLGICKKKKQFIQWTMYRNTAEANLPSPASILYLYSNVLLCSTLTAVRNLIFLKYFVKVKRNKIKLTEYFKGDGYILSF